MLFGICRYCGSRNIRIVGGDYGDPFDRKPEQHICQDCGSVSPMETDISVQGGMNMSSAIKIRVEKAPAEYDYGRSKFFGDPTIPSAWQDRFVDDIIFFAQIRLEELAPFDKENRLPHTGYLYFFMDTEAYPYDVWIDHYDGEPEMLLGEFNDAEPQFAHLNQAWLMSFEECDALDDGMKLFGIPSSEVDEEEAPLLLQFDPLEAPMGFLQHIDGYAYIFSDPKEQHSAVRLVVDHL